VEGVFVSLLVEKDLDLDRWQSWRSRSFTVGMRVFLKHRGCGARFLEEIVLGFQFFPGVGNKEQENNRGRQKRLYLSSFFDTHL